MKDNFSNASASSSNRLNNNQSSLDHHSLRDNFAKRTNQTGLPDQLKKGAENLSGISLDDVKVHFNSLQPKQLMADAFAKGSEIYVAPGQEKHLAHETWHVVQQKQGKVKPTFEANERLINDDRSLEKEADVMGTRAESVHANAHNGLADAANPNASHPVIQRHISYNNVANQFEVDASRPTWQGALSATPARGQSRNHVIDFENIQNDLANMLNTLLVANTAPNRATLTRMVNSLVPSAGAYRTATLNHLNNLIAAITAGNTALYHAESRALLSRLNSSPDNVRIGNSAINSSIGQNIDAEFNAGTTPYNGNVRTAAGTIAHNGPVLTLTPAHNRIVYEYLSQTTQGGLLTFVINPVTNRQLSSTQPPTVANRPVLITDPAGAATPFLFQ